MCVILERIHVRSSGVRETLEVPYLCMDSKEGKCCSNIAREQVQYYTDGPVVGPSDYTSMPPLVRLQKHVFEMDHLGDTLATGRGPSSHSMSSKSSSSRYTASSSSYYTASSRGDRYESRSAGSVTWHDIEEESEEVSQSEWQITLHEKGVIVSRLDELDWSGRGQHIEYAVDEVPQIPLTDARVIGHSASALVESVRCRRIQLARKTIKCNRRLTREDAIMEVKHLQDLRHFHVLRVVGTYTIGKDLSILLYPVTEWNMEEFMERVVEQSINGVLDGDAGKIGLVRFFGCLSNAAHYIHSMKVKHMDIKPKNILVKQYTPVRYQVYIADFGIARSYASLEDAETDSATSFTRKYAAPEVILQDKRGFSADIFSLGCVFTEMFATVCSDGEWNAREELEVSRVNAWGDTSYQANIEKVQAWLREALTRFDANPFGMYWQRKYSSELSNSIPQMINEDPKARPIAYDLKSLLGVRGCEKCHAGRQPFQAS